MDSVPDGISYELYQEFKRAEFQLKLSRRRYLEAKILREAWTEICLPDYKMEGASSEEQEEEFRREFRRVRDAVLLAEQPLPGLAPPPTRPPSDNLQATIHDLLSKQLDRVSTALSECGGKSKSDNQPVEDKVESTCMNVAMLQDKLHELRLQCSKRLVELTRIFHDGAERAVATPELGEGARQLLRNWQELKNLHLQLKKAVTEGRSQITTLDMMQVYDRIRTDTRRESYSLEEENAKMKGRLAEFDSIWGDDVQELLDDYRTTLVEVEAYRVAIAKQQASGDAKDCPADIAGASP
ncbi:unnamed protein product [Ixodes pacificus]